MTWMTCIKPLSVLQLSHRNSDQLTGQWWVNCPSIISRILSNSVLHLHVRTVGTWSPWMLAVGQFLLKCESGARQNYSLLCTFGSYALQINCEVLVLILLFWFLNRIDRSKDAYSVQSFKVRSNSCCWYYYCSLITLCSLCCRQWPHHNTQDEGAFASFSY